MDTKSPECPLLYFDKGPIHGGVDYRDHKIWWPLVQTRAIHMPVDKTKFPVWPCALLHELAHVLAGEPPNYISEPESEMIAFEYHSVRFLHLHGWTKWMHNYGVEGEYWQDLSVYKRHDVLVTSAGYARECALLDKKLKPTFTPPWCRPHAQ